MKTWVSVGVSHLILNNFVCKGFAFKTLLLMLEQFVGYTLKERAITYQEYITYIKCEIEFGAHSTQLSTTKPILLLI